MNLGVHSITARRAIALSALAIALAGVAACRPRPTVAVARVTRQPLAQSLVVSGRVMAPVRVNIGTMVTGTVKRRLVEEGRHVADRRGAAAAGRCRGASGRAAGACECRSAGSAARAAADGQRGGRVGRPLAGRRPRCARAERELQRLQTLADAGLVTTSQLDDARKAVDIARSQQDAAAAQYAGSRPSGVDERAARAAIEQARAALAAAQTRLSQMTIRAPQAGVIIARRVEAGDIVQTGQTLLELAVDGPDAAHHRPGREEPLRHRARPAGGRVGRRVPIPDLCRGRQLHRRGGRSAARDDRGAPHGAVAARIPAARHDRVGRPRGRAARRGARGALRRHSRRDRPRAVGAPGPRRARRAAQRPRRPARRHADARSCPGVGEGDLVVPASAGSPEPGTTVRARGSGEVETCRSSGSSRCATCAKAARSRC